MNLHSQKWKYRYACTEIGLKFIDIDLHTVRKSGVAESLARTFASSNAFACTYGGESFGDMASELLSYEDAASRMRSMQLENYPLFLLGHCLCGDPILYVETEEDLLVCYLDMSSFLIDQDYKLVSTGLAVGDFMLAFAGLSDASVNLDYHHQRSAEPASLEFVLIDGMVVKA